MVCGVCGIEASGDGDIAPGGWLVGAGAGVAVCGIGNEVLAAWDHHVICLEGQFAGDA